MRREKLTAIIYALPAVACSLFMLWRNTDLGALWKCSIIWLCVAAFPLTFVFAYGRFLLAAFNTPRSRWYAAVYHGLAGATVTALFLGFSPFWKNPLRDLGDSILLLLLALTAEVVFLVGAVSIFLKNRSGLAIPASILVWPYWLALALLFEGRSFQDTGIYAIYFLLAFFSPLLFAFAAGAALSRPMVGHIAALSGILAVPFLYDALRDNGLGNVWLVFNQPDDKYAFYPPFVVPAIACVACIALAGFTGALRVLGARWRLRNAPISETTWPAVVFSFAVLAIWFGQSVLPYRIPGAMDYSQWPILQILHVEKHGLQFHETRVAIDGYERNHSYFPRSVVFSGNDRRLLHFQFEERSASSELSEPLIRRIQTSIGAFGQPRQEWPPVGPVRDWDADNWYVVAQGGLKIYSTRRGSSPPAEVVALFNDLQKIPHSLQGKSNRRDVCLGFCYDPLSEMGYLYANHRCFNNGHGTVRR